MAESSKVFKKSFVGVCIFSFVFMCASSFSFYADAPKAPAPSYTAEHPKLCNFDDVYKVEIGDKMFDEIDSCNVGLLKLCRIHRIYQLGDSISDVGNLIREVPMGAATPFARRPYGINFPTGPTGRASDGKLMIDYYAIDAALPLLPPFKKSDADFSHGVNFAVGGATALPWNVLAAMNISTPMTTSSLSVQLDWMSTYFNSICQNQIDCGGRFENALFMVGPFGGSDYHNAIFQAGKSFPEIKITLVPKVVDSIMVAVRRVINLGAKKVVVPGLYTISRLPIYRTTFPEETWDVYDDLALDHDAKLRDAIDKLNQQERPDAIVVYGDYYAAYESLLTYAIGELDLTVCCGGGGNNIYKFDLKRMCGAEGVSSCKQPQKAIYWDGLHLTQEAYRIMTKYMLYHLFKDLHC